MEHSPIDRALGCHHVRIALFAVLGGGGCYLESGDSPPRDTEAGATTAAASTTSSIGDAGSTGDDAVATGTLDTTDTTDTTHATDADVTTTGRDTSDSDGGGSTGPAPACTLDADCGDANPCTIDVCDGDECVYVAIDGLGAPQQLAGDCRVIQCIQGAIQEVIDPEDLPDDQNDCTFDACDGDAPIHSDAPAGTPCTDGTVCDGLGTCDECASPVTCDALPEDDDCQVRACDDGMCGQDFAPAGAPVNATLQVAGDCRRVVCDGIGGTTIQADVTDPTVDGLECTSDLCDGNTPDNPPRPRGTPCSAGECNAQGACVGCNEDEDCGTAEFCQAPICGPQGVCGIVDTDAGTALPGGFQQPADCVELRCDGAGAVAAYADDTDLPQADGNACTGDICFGGLEQHPAEAPGTPCDDGGGTLCDGFGACVECLSAADCDPPAACDVAICSEGTCSSEPAPADSLCDDGLFCTANDVCDGDGVCSGSGSPCAGADNDSDCSKSCDEQRDSCTGTDVDGTGCSDSAFCTSGDVCASGVCSGVPVTCQGNDRCGEICRGCCST